MASEAMSPEEGLDPPRLEGNTTIRLKKANLAIWDNASVVKVNEDRINTFVSGSSKWTQGTGLKEAITGAPMPVKLLSHTAAPKLPNATTTRLNTKTMGAFSATMAKGKTVRKDLALFTGTALKEVSKYLWAGVSVGKS